MDTYAELFGATNHAGADIQIGDADMHAIVGQFQLKATDSIAYVKQHIDRYPDIEVMVTNETAEKMARIDSSGIDNAEISEKVNLDIEALADNTIGERVADSAELSAVISTGQDLIEMLREKKIFRSR